MLIIMASVGILTYAAMLPKNFSVSRLVVIDAPPETIFPFINDIGVFVR